MRQAGRKCEVRANVAGGYVARGPRGVMRGVQCAVCGVLCAARVSWRGRATPGRGDRPVAFWHGRKAALAVARDAQTLTRPAHEMASLPGSGQRTGVRCQRAGRHAMTRQRCPALFNFSDFGDFCMLPDHRRESHARRHVAGHGRPLGVSGPGNDGDRMISAAHRQSVSPGPWPLEPVRRRPMRDATAHPDKRKPGRPARPARPSGPRSRPAPWSGATVSQWARPPGCPTRSNCRRNCARAGTPAGRSTRTRCGCCAHRCGNRR